MMLAGIIVIYGLVALLWFVGWGFAFGNELQGERRLAASMMLLCWAWPLVVIPFILYGIFILLRAALGRE